MWSLLARNLWLILYSDIFLRSSYFFVGMATILIESSKFIVNSALWIIFAMFTFLCWYDDYFKSNLQVRKISDFHFVAQTVVFGISTFLYSVWGIIRFCLGDENCVVSISDEISLTFRAVWLHIPNFYLLN